MSKEEQYQKLCEINRVEGFDPAAFAVEYTDMNTGEVRKRLPVMIQMAWFRLKYPEGRIAVEVTPAKDCLWRKPGSIPTIRTARSATWLKPQPPGGLTRTIPRFPPGNGPRLRPWALPCATRVSAYSSARRGGLLPKLPGGTDHRNAHLQTGRTGL